MLPSPREANLALIGQAVSEEKIFENDARGWLYYKLTSHGSGELKKTLHRQPNVSDLSYCITFNAPQKVFTYKLI